MFKGKNDSAATEKPKREGSIFRRVMKSVFGDPMDRAVAKFRDRVEQINALEADMKALDDAALRAKTQAFKQRLAAGETLDDILYAAFAAVREASVRTIGLRHYDVQLIGGMVLHEGRIAEMKTGEGKTLVATLPLYLNALSGKGVHLVTPNDYLSKFGLQTMGPIYHFLGLTAGVIQNTGGGNPDAGSFVFDPHFPSEDARYQNLRPVTRREAYQADITYGTNNEFGFDYLRDNMAWEKTRLTQRDLNFAIVDEVDNILIDEARTPLIISGPADAPSEYYAKFTQIVKRLKRSSSESIAAEDPDGDFIVDEKDRIAYLTEAGVERVEQMLGINHLYHAENAEMIPYLDNCLRAMALYHRDHEYVVQDKQVVIVDDFTGRLMPGRRFSEGLHQAIEAKEGVEIRRENMTMATITFQNYFRMYEKLAGMTGTALTEQEEFEKIYELDVITIPTNLTIQRADLEDLIFVTQRAKWNAVVNEIKTRHENGQPVLVGTVAIETSEYLGKLLDKAKVPHEILNAKQHEREAGIIAQAGRAGAVTIATNMAGRGVDILLGGNPEGLAREMLRRQEVDMTTATPEQWESAFADAKDRCAKDRQKVLAAGGLYVLGTERHEARRIDNQLRGRAGRQGDPGETRFYLSLEDDLMRRFNGEQVKKFMSWANLPEDEPLEHNLVTRSIEQAQIRVEGHNFDIRKRVLEYDDVVNRQREIIYNQRREWLDKLPEDLHEDYLELVKHRIQQVVETHAEPEDTLDYWDVDLLHKDLFTVFPVPETINPDTMVEMTRAQLQDQLVAAAEDALKRKETELEAVNPGTAAYAQRLHMLRVIDFHWQRHLTALDMLREGIGLMSIAQRDPVVEYKREGFIMFDEMQGQITTHAVRDFFNIRAELPRIQQRQMQIARPVTNAPAAETPQTVRNVRKLGRNDPCWCGSGKKYKNCHMREDEAKERQHA
jgi:preprotein translocase subunit SecA